MYADELKQALWEKMYGDGVGMATDVMGMGTDGTGMGTGVVGMGRNLWGWSEYGENKLSLCSSVSDYENDGCCLKLRCANSV